jgi:hypothetical protein
LSNKIQIRRGTDAERMRTILANGEPAWTTDTNKLYIGDGVTLGGRLVNDGNIPYGRNAYSARFNSQVNVASVVDALDFIFDFVDNMAVSYFAGESLSNEPIVNDIDFAKSLSMSALPSGQKTVDVIHFSNSTYRVFMYPMAFGPILDIQDPGFNFVSIRNAYEPIPRQVTYQGTVFYVYFTQDPALSLSGKTIRYVLA